MRNPHKPIDIAYVFAPCAHASRPRIDFANSAGSSVRGNRWPYTSSVIVMGHAQAVLGLSFLHWLDEYQFKMLPLFVSGFRSAD